MVKKGVTQSLAILIIVAGVVVLVASLSITGIVTRDITRPLTVQQEIFTLGNSLKLGKLYLETSLAFAYYQSCYDVLSKGGYAEIPPESIDDDHPWALWNVDDLIDTEEARTNVNSQTQTFLAYYTSRGYQALGHRVQLPGSYTVESQDQGTTLTLIAHTDDSLFSTFSEPNFNETINLYKNATLIRAFPRTCLDLFEEGRSQASLADDISTIFLEENAALLASGMFEQEGDISFTPGNEQNEMMELVFFAETGESFSDARDAYGEAVEARLPDPLPSPQDGRYYVSLEPLGLEGAIIPSCQSVKETRQAGETEKLFTTITCDFDYITLYTGGVTVQDTLEESRLPVNTGEQVEFAPPELRFAIQVAMTRDAPLDTETAREQLLRGTPLFP